MVLKHSKKMIMKCLLPVMLFLLAMTGLKAQDFSSDDFKVRGFHLDLRIQVMTPQALRSFARELAAFGINTLVMEYEASYPYKNQATISNKLAYTRDEIRSFIKYCNGLGMDVIPLQQCFGHVEYILRHDRYADLREDNTDLSQVCPTKAKEDSLLFSDLFRDMASMHTSKYIHIGGDETRLLGHCPLCSKKVALEGKSKLFVDYMRMISNIVVKLGKIPVMWADILLKNPEAADELPKQTIFIDWNYGWKTNYFGDIGALQKKGFTFWGAPALRSHPDNWYVTCWEKHFDNLRDFVPYARLAGYKGMVMTSWSTSGLYDLKWGADKDVIDMFQIRNTYPLSGFRIMVATYAQALKQQTGLDSKGFVRSYAKERFGLDDKDGAKLWQALTLQPGLILAGKPAGNYSISGLLRENELARKQLNILKPLKNQKEFEHFRLMADLRSYYLDFKKLDSIYNSNGFTRAQAKQLIPGLRKLLNESKELDQRFYDLNKGFLYDSEIREQNFIRNKPVKELYFRIVGTKHLDYAAPKI